MERKARAQGPREQASEPHQPPPARRCQWPSDTALAVPRNQPPSADTCWLSCVGWAGKTVVSSGLGAYWGLGRGARCPIPVGFLPFVVVCRLLIVGDGLGRHGAGAEGKGVAVQPLPITGRALGPLHKLGPNPTPSSSTQTSGDSPSAHSSETSPSPRGPAAVVLPHHWPGMAADHPSPSRCPPAPSHRSRQWKCGAWPRS